MNNDAGGASASNDGLGPLPDPMKDYPEPGERVYTEEALIQFGRQERAAEREQCAEEIAMLRRLVRSYEHQVHRSVNELEFGA